MGYRERRSHARGVYPTQYPSRMETARVKQEAGADTRIIVKLHEIRKKWGKTQTKPDLR